MQIAEELKAMFYVLEHRYYGSSQPVEDWSTENMKYLNADQALADLAGFIDAKNAEIKDRWPGKEVKWITVGGSYPGALSAWMKAAYPDKVHIAWSSSGVILPIRDFTEYDMSLFESSSRSGTDCTDVMHGITKYIDEILDAYEEGKRLDDYAYLQYVFGFDKIHFGDFMFYIADIFTVGIQYGERRAVCDMLASIKFAEPKAQLPVI